MEDSELTKDKQKPEKKRFTKWPEAIFLGSVTGASILFGFGSTLASAKKKDPEYFNKGLTPQAAKMEAGASLAMRALGWGTVYAVGGCGILFYAVWKLLGVNDLREFRIKAGNMLPAVPKNDPPQSRTEFKNLTDLLQYIIDEDNKSKMKKDEPATDKLDAVK